jgi:3-hydroxyanthranilate 3,4-dioxygenase
MSELRIVDLAAAGAGLAAAPRPVRVLWQERDNLAFIARGRPGRSEFHIDPSDEIMVMLKGEMELHYLTPQGERKVATLRQGEMLHCPAGLPHSPRFPPDAVLLVIERPRKPGEVDRFLWLCECCEKQLYEAAREVADYRSDPVTSVYDEFYGTPGQRSCSHCGHVAKRP